MRIAVVHSFYSSRQPSGENIVVDLQVDALRRAGHDVRLVSRSTDELEQSVTYPVRAGLRAATGRGDSPLDELHEFAPDIVHVHNLFPNLGRRWVERLDLPLVTTLHNYRPICPEATLFRDGHSCTLCPDSGSAWHDRAGILRANHAGKNHDQEEPGHDEGHIRRGHRGRKQEPENEDDKDHRHQQRHPLVIAETAGSTPRPSVVPDLSCRHGPPFP